MLSESTANSEISRSRSWLWHEGHSGVFEAAGSAARTGGRRLDIRIRRLAFTHPRGLRAFPTPSPLLSSHATGSMPITFLQQERETCRLMS